METAEIKSKINEIIQGKNAQDLGMGNDLHSKLQEWIKNDGKISKAKVEEDIRKWSQEKLNKGLANSAAAHHT